VCDGGQRPWNSSTGRGSPALRALTAERRPVFASSVSNSGRAMSNIVSSAAATPPTLQARSSALCAAYARVGPFEILRANASASVSLS
jgi:hypothetical protein